MQDDVLSSTAVRPNFVLAPPSCPSCKSGMRVVKATPIALTSDLVDVSYVCDECGRETKWTIKGI